MTHPKPNARGLLSLMLLLAGCSPCAGRAGIGGGPTGSQVTGYRDVP